MVHDAVLQHGIEIAHSPMVMEAVSFLKVGPALQALSDAGHSMAHWVGDHLPTVGHHDPAADVAPRLAAPQKEQAEEAMGAAAAAPAAVVPEEHWGGGRMIEFFAQSCPHCQHLEPIWSEASQKWLTEHPGKEADTVHWEQKECYGEGWGEGRDHDECMQEGVHSFPTVRFYSKSGKKFADFTDERTAAKLLGFAEQHATPHERPAPLEETRMEQPAIAALTPAAPAGAVGAGPVKVIEYVAKSCPHCQSMEPLWKDAQSQWAAKATNPKVQWEQKECFAQGWVPGKDLEECKRSNIEGFPTLKIFGGTSPAAGEEFSGPRSVPNLLSWVQQHTGQAAADSVSAVQAAAVQASAGPLFAAALCAPVLTAALRREGKAHFL